METLEKASPYVPEEIKFLPAVSRFNTGLFNVATSDRSPSCMHDYKLTRERREREKAEVLMRFRTFAERSTWKKARLSRELGVSLSTIDRWLHGHDKIMLASMLEIRRFLREMRGE